QVGVGEDTALGAAGGAGGVADGGRGAGGEPATALGHLLVRDVLAEGGQVGERAGVHLPDPWRGFVGGRAGDDGGGVLRGLGDGVAGTGVPDDPLHLVGGGGGVDRDGHTAGRPDGEVEDRPL